ncbi:citrate lyase subunit alpha [Labilibaculum manganireducens]|uniref:Citrate lyase alpha chain n=1 Tax=Labilibaculum manganireducens TaxID=1940525 RepID=A0A2N3I4P8_9BACT|nr:citrate lyase subunit alpha [Labilibaculum manganireducens]PKQ65272.1 citrate lyase subunit alpha [Labilibaculum manganireducens]
MKNAIGVEIPEYIEGLGKLEPFQGVWKSIIEDEVPSTNISRTLKAKKPHVSKLCKNLEEAIKRCKPFDGMTVTCHHHLRGGDGVLMQAIKILDEMGIKDITLASSSLTSAHDGLVPYVEKGMITRIFTSGIRGALGDAISVGKLKYPAIIHSHGGRVRDFLTGRIKPDLSVLAASAADEEGNATGAHGPSAFGSMGYADIDARYSRNVIIVTDNLVEYPCVPCTVRQHFIDYVVKVDSIGDATKIASGTTRITNSPMDLRIARIAATVIEHSGLFKNGMSFQVGAGGASLAVAKFLREDMKRKNIIGSFMIGGVTSYGVDMLNEGLFHSIFDVQSFDAAVSTSVLNNPNHIEISCDQYANPNNCGSMTNKLDVVVLGALEVDVDFNVNVITGSSGEIRGASGGHSDTASGANLTVVVCPAFRGRLPIVKDRVHTVVTPGESVDVIVTERGVCVNPAKPNLAAKLKEAGVQVVDIRDLKEEVEKMTGVPAEKQLGDQIVGLVEYRDGTIIDVIYNVKNLS